VRPCRMISADIGCSGGTPGRTTRSPRETVSLAERRLPIMCMCACMREACTRSGVQL
jgi:hypothetical protein